jgi:hypothetical protein
LSPLLFGSGFVTGLVTGGLETEVPCLGGTRPNRRLRLGTAPCSCWKTEDRISVCCEYGTGRIEKVVGNALMC